MIQVTRKEIVRYTLTPQVLPRLRALFVSGFQTIPYLVALVYQTVRLLPENHPYLDARNIGSYGIRHVIAQAADHLVISRKNIDQMVIFGLILMGIILAFFQIFLVGLSVFSMTFSPAMAQSAANGFTSFTQFFTTAPPDQDLAFIMMDMVFGVPGVFDSCVAKMQSCLGSGGGTVSAMSQSYDISNMRFPLPVHEALHFLFHWYNIGLLVVAAFIILYFMATVVLETAQTGTAFGKRFEKVWAPLRLVVAIGLLMPIGNGLNSAQYIVLYAAKYGSGFATNGWKGFTNNLDMGANLMGAYSNSSLVSEPNPPRISSLLQFMYVAAVCRDLHTLYYGDEVPEGAPAGTKPEPKVRMYAVKGNPQGQAMELSVANVDAPKDLYKEFIEFANGAEQMTIRFGVHDETTYASDLGHVSNECGQITFPILDPRVPGSASGPDAGPEIMQRYYLYLLVKLWSELFYEEDALTDTLYVDQNLQRPSRQSMNAGSGQNGQQAAQDLPNEWTYWTAAYYSQKRTVPPDFEYAKPPADFKRILIDAFKVGISKALRGPQMQLGEGYYNDILADLPDYLTREGQGGFQGAIEAQIQSGDWNFSEELAAKGWAGAGMWYNKVAQLNGAVANSVYGVPMVTTYPAVMERVLDLKREQQENIAPEERFNPRIEGGKLSLSHDLQTMAETLWQGYSYWGGMESSTSPSDMPTNNKLIDVLNQFLGTDGLFSMRKNEDVHPLAQLVGVGKALVNSAIRNIGISAGVSVLSAASGNTLSAIGPAIISFTMSIAMIGLTIGFILFYVVPFLPFVYFFFAVGGWVKGIFEAMVGAPLWALAHLRIDGKGLPGQAAKNGYFLIFEIFIRPILIIFGLLASISTFSALVYVLNDTWDLVAGNVAGFDVNLEAKGVDTTGQPLQKNLSDFFRGPVDEFFFTVIYTIVVYMMAMSSFKMIDLVPNNILRWMGESVKTFNDEQQDAAKSMMGTAAIGSQQVIRTVGGGVSGALTSVASSGASSKAPQ